MRHPRALRLWPALSLVALVTHPGCRRDRVPEAVELGPLAAGPMDQVMAKLVRAHYDPQALGLKELAFTAEMSLPKHQTLVSAEGSWKAGDGPRVKILQTTRKGKVEHKPPDPGLGQQIWTSLQYQLQNFLDGMGSGFLSRRLAEWQKISGKCQMVGEKLSLSFDEGKSRSVVTVGPGYVVERVENRVAGTMTRSMEYHYQTERGRNLVTSAELRLKLENEATLPAKALKGLKGSDGMRFELAYQQVQGLLLPVRLRKLTPGLQDEAIVTIHYTAIKR